MAHLFKNVKAQIKDGTSLLYDFKPLYFGMNLGSSGFSTGHNLKDFILLSKVGQFIEGEEYIVSVMRNKKKPLVFKVLALNLELREEFMMELTESDIYELIEGDQHILRNAEPEELIKKILAHLNIIERDKIKVLTCEHKIFFNELWLTNMVSTKHTQIHQRSRMESDMPSWNGAQKQRDQQVHQSVLTNTACRSIQLQNKLKGGD